MYEVFLTREAQHEHPNIKQLKGPLAGHFRYRIGDWQVIYQVDE